MFTIRWLEGAPRHACWQEEGGHHAWVLARFLMAGTFYGVLPEPMDNVYPFCCQLKRCRVLGLNPADHVVVSHDRLEHTTHAAQHNCQAKS